MKDFKIIICSFVVIVLLGIMITKSDTKEINQKIISINGETISIEDKILTTDTPFIIKSKNDRIYKITYKDKNTNEIKIGYVRFRSFDTNWELK